MSKDNANNTNDLVTSLNHNLALYYQHLLGTARAVQQAAYDAYVAKEITLDEFREMSTTCKLPATELSALNTFLKNNDAAVDAGAVQKDLESYEATLEDTKQQIKDKKEAKSLALLPED